MTTPTSPHTNGNGKRVSAVVEAPTQHVVITAPRMMVAEFTCTSTAPLCINRFSDKAQREMQATQAAGSQAKSKKTRDAKDFDALYKAATYQCGTWYGIHAAALRLGMIDACRLVGFKMTLGKMAVRVLHDGLDDLDGTPLVRIHGEPPTKDVRHVRNATGVIDLRARPLWREWSLKPRIEYDADQFSLVDVTNLMARVGKQIGVGEGRPYSRQSAGLGFGLFDVTGGR